MVVFILKKIKGSSWLEFNFKLSMFLVAFLTPQRGREDAYFDVFLLLLVAEQRKKHQRFYLHENK